MKLVLFIVSIAFSLSSFAQEEQITSKLYETYNLYKETTLKHRREKHSNIQPLINKLKKNKKYTIKKVGTSIEGRDLTLISIGKGKTNVFLWSQMHGDEPTATAAIFDIINFLNSDDFCDEKKAILKACTLHFLPMVNPDGAQRYTRRNALGIDINRDALRLQSPEGRTLKKVRDSLQANFGFNLHDQSTYYNAERTSKPATISYLAPAYNYEKDINEVRGNAMKVIVFMNNIIQKYAPGQVGKYNDDFEPRAFGDNIQKWGTSTILIESGGYKNDTEKQEIRKLNYVSILSAIYTIAKENYKSIAIADYNKIPENNRKLFDLKLEAVTYNLLGKDYLLDVGINRLEIDNAKHTSYYNLGIIKDQGDLSTFYGYQTFNAKGYKIVPGKIWKGVFNSIEDLTKVDVISMLKAGYIYMKTKQQPKVNLSVTVPVIVVKENFNVPKFTLFTGNKASFLLQKNGVNEYAVINGFLINLQDSLKTTFRNGLIYR